MRRGRIFFYLAFIIILLVVAGFVVWQRFFNASPITPGEQPIAEATPIIDLVDVIVVTQPIQRGTVIDETVLGVIPIPRDVFIQGMFSDMASVVDRQAKFDLDAGIPLTASMLVDSAEQLSDIGSLAALSIPRGQVAVSIPIDRLSSVSYAPRPGDHVSVIATMLFVDMDTEFQAELPNQAAGVLSPGPGIVIGSGTGDEIGTEFRSDENVNNITARIVGGGSFSLAGRTELDPVLNELIYVIPSEAQRARLVSQTLLKDVAVLQIGDFKFPAQEEAEAQQELVAAETAQEQPEGQDTGVVEDAGPEPPDVITLVVTPQDAVTLNYLMYSGAELTLALRAAGDDSSISTEAATLQFLLDTYNIPVPAKLPYGMEPSTNELVAPQLENDGAGVP